MIESSSPSTLDTDPAYPPLKQFAIERTGFDYEGDREADLIHKLKLRMETCGISECIDYLSLLQDDIRGGAEFDALIAELTVGETHFFRHQEMFHAIRDLVLPNVVERNRECRRIRVWSAGCSIGAEPYSMSILIREFLGPRADAWDISILGTDINRDSLSRAQRGEFDDWALRSVSEDDRRRYFDRQNGRWIIRPAYRQHVRFQYHNLVKHRFPSPAENLVAFDIVLCRNVMIYFSAEVNAGLVRRLYDALCDEGWLIVGHAEPQGPSFENFQQVLAAGAVLYQKAARIEQRENPTTDGAAPTRLADESRPPLAHMPAPHFAAVARGNMTGLLSTSRPGPKMSDLQVAQLSPEITSTSSCVVSTKEPDELTGRRLAEVRSLADHGELERAIAACSMLLDEQKHCPRVHFHFALLMEQTGRADEAEQCLRRAIALDPRDILAHFYLGLIHLRKRNASTAARSFKTALDLSDGLAPNDHVAGADEMKICHLRQLTRMHLFLLEQGTA